MRTQQHGVTLLEVLLVMAIAASIFVAGIRQYQIYKLQTDAEQIKANVDKVFQAASNYYQVECRANRLPKLLYPSDANKLAPTVAANIVSIDIKTDLIDKGYLTENIPLNPLVSATGGKGYTGYKVQFVRSSEPRYICTKAVDGEEALDPYDTSKCATKKQTGTIVNWQIQASAALRDGSLGSQLLNMTAAECLSSASGSNGVVPCTQAASYAANCEAATDVIGSEEATPEDKAAAQQAFDDGGCGGSGEGGFGNYLSFQRLPSFSTAVESQSGLGATNKTLQQFKQMYETANINYLLGVGHDPEYQYFNCGN